jgi:hypothetical protein
MCPSLPYHYFYQIVYQDSQRKLHIDADEEPIFGFKLKEYVVRIYRRISLSNKTDPDGVRNAYPCVIIYAVYLPNSIHLESLYYLETCRRTAFDPDCVRSAA